MREWRELTRGLGRLLGPQAGSLQGLAYDSRRVEPGFGFIAVPGQRDDGHRHVAEALERGARALVVERADAVPPGTPALVVPDARRAMAVLAARFYDHPSRDLGVVGVTGTNGKTTTAFLARLGLSTLAPAGLVGTVWTTVGGRSFESERTTPEALDLTRTLAEMREAGDRFAALEASSEGLAQDRALGLDLNVAVFTNLTQDHLNFHGTMDNYFEAKCRLFDLLSSEPEGGHGGGRRLAVVNGDDAYGRRLAERCRRAGTETAVWSVPADGGGGAGSGGAATEADLVALDVEAGPESVSFLAVSRAGSPLGEWRTPVALPIGGRFNVANALAAFAAAVALGADPEAVAAAFRDATPVPGRFEGVKAGQPFAVLVDYAHSPDGLRNVLEAAREVTRGRLLVVFGAGGDRDRGKRPLMGEVAASLADRVVLTSDNPRSEDPEAIIDDIAAGAREAAARTGAAVAREADRRLAIRGALSEARPGDTVVIAGKGHETYQIFRDRTISFDDRAVAREELRRLGWGDGS